MRAAHQVALRAADALQELAHQRDLRSLARVRRAGQRQVLAVQPESFDHAVFHQRPRLKRLGGGTPEGHVRGIARLGNQLPTGIHDGDMDPVAGFEKGSPI